MFDLLGIEASPDALSLGASVRHGYFSHARILRQTYNTRTHKCSALSTVFVYLPVMRLVPVITGKGIDKLLVFKVVLSTGEKSRAPLSSSIAELPTWIATTPTMYAPDCHVTTRPPAPSQCSSSAATSLSRSQRCPSVRTNLACTLCRCRLLESSPDTCNKGLCFSTVH